MSIQQFLKAKEHLSKKKAQDEAQFKRRSQLYESIKAQNESNTNQARSTNSNNIPVMAVAKLEINPVSPGDLFSACRNGSDREKSTKPKVPADTMSMIRLARSRSDVGFKNKGFGPSSPQCIANHLQNQQQPSPSSQKLDRRSELEEMQFRIRKSKTVTPLGDICSTFLGKHINQTSGCLSNEESDENPLSHERRRLLKKTRPRSVYQNVNDGSGAYYYPEDQENLTEEEGGQEQNTNPFFNNYEQDPGFTERCKFLEKSLYNSVS